MRLLRSPRSRFLSSNQRRDAPELTLRRQRCPVFHEFSLVHFSPLDDQPENARRKIALPQFQRSNTRHGAKFLVANVEMRRIVIVEVHRDHDSEEAADFRHGCAPTDYPVLASWCGSFLL